MEKDMTREAWELQKLLREMAAWQKWAGKTLDQFQADVDRLVAQRRLQTKDVGDVTVLTEKVKTVKQALTEVDKHLNRATHGRVRNSKR